MSKFVRLIQRSKWPSNLDKYIENIDEIDAKIIVQEMPIKGAESALSIWKLDDKTNMVLALFGREKKFIQRMQFVLIDEELLNNSQLEVRNTKGNSMAEDLNTLHYDIYDMSYKDLGKFAKVILEALKDDKNVITATDKEVGDILRDAVIKNRINKAELVEELKTKLNI